MADLDLGFDAILGELDKLEKQFEIEHTSKLNGNSSEQKHAIHQSIKTSSFAALSDFNLINSQLEDVLNDLSTYQKFEPVHNELEEIKNDIKEEEEEFFPPPPSPNEMELPPPKPPLPPSTSPKPQSVNSSNESQISCPKNKTPPAIPVKKKHSASKSIVSQPKQILSNQTDISKKSNKISFNEKYIQVFENKKSEITNHLENDKESPSPFTGISNKELNNSVCKTKEPLLSSKTSCDSPIIFESQASSKKSFEKRSLNSFEEESFNRNSNKISLNSPDEIHYIQDHLRSPDTNQLISNHDSLNCHTSQTSHPEVDKNLESQGVNGFLSEEKNLVSLLKQPVQACVKVTSFDGSEKVVYVTGETTVGLMCDHMVHEHIVGSSRNSFSLWEVQSELFLERELEKEMLVLEDVVDRWPRNSYNSLVMRSPSVRPQSFLFKGELESPLHVRMDEKKSWKSFLFTLKQSGIFYYPKTKNKSDMIGFCDLTSGPLQLFTFSSWKKKLKSPTEFGFALKPAGENNLRAVKHFCAESEPMQAVWLQAISQILNEVLTSKDKKCQNMKGEQLIQHQKNFTPQHQIHQQLQSKQQALQYQPLQTQQQTNFSKQNISQYQQLKKQNLFKNSQKEVIFHHDPKFTKQFSHPNFQPQFYGSPFSNLSQRRASEQINLNSLTFTDDINLYSEPFETFALSSSRRLSNASTNHKSELEGSMSAGPVRKVANLPITIGTTKILQSLHQTNLNSYMTIPKPMKQEEKKILHLTSNTQAKESSFKPLACPNDYTPSPTQGSITNNYNSIKTLPKPTKSSNVFSPIFSPQLNQEDSLDSNNHPNYRTLPSPLKSKTLPPAPPRRDQNTKLTSQNQQIYQTSSTCDYKDNMQLKHIQTQNFILNLNRTICNKKMHGVEGLSKLEIPLPPPPVCSEDSSYLENGDLPPPPAELLQELKHPSLIYQKVSNY